MNGTLVSNAVACALALTAVACARNHPGEAGKDEARTITVRCVKPTREAIDETVSLRGRIEPPSGGDLAVAPQVAGRVVSLSVREGDTVAAGDVVASIDDAPTRDVARQSGATLAQARAADVNAAATLERTRQLVARGIAARQELEDATAKAEAARQAVAAAAAGDDSARRTLGRVQVRTGVAGRVTKIFRGAGALVDGTPATPLLQLAASSGAELVADVPQRDLFRLAEGQHARGALAGADGLKLEGTVRTRPRALDAATGLGSVRITLTSEAARDLPVGAFGHVLVDTGRRENALVVPQAALRGAISDGAEIVVCAGNKAAIKLVTVGYRDDKRVEILAGLGPDDEIAIDHLLALEDDTPIKRQP